MRIDSNPCVSSFKAIRFDIGRGGLDAIDYFTGKNLGMFSTCVNLERKNPNDIIVAMKKPTFLDRLLGVRMLVFSQGDKNFECPATLENAIRTLERFVKFPFLTVSVKENGELNYQHFDVFNSTAKSEKIVNMQTQQKKGNVFTSLMGKASL